MTEMIPGDHPVHEVTGLEEGTLSGRKALGLAVVVFSPVLTAATVGAFVMSVSGSSAWLSVLVGAVIMACVSVTIAPFASRFVVSGALYSYIGHALGPFPKLVSGASLAVGYVVGMMAALGALALYTGSLLSTTFGISAANELPGQIVIFAVALLGAAVLAYRGLDTSARLSIGLMAITAPVVALILLANLFSGDFDVKSQFSFDDFTFTGFAMGVVLTATFLVGIEASAATAAETADPKRTVPRVIIAVPLIVGGIGLIATILSVPALATDEVQSAMTAGESPIAALADHAGLSFLGGIADLALVLTCLAVLIGFMNYAPRVLATMAADGLLPSTLGKVSPRTHTPVTAIVAIAVLTFLFPAILAAVTGGSTLQIYTAVATLFPYMWVLPYILIAVGGTIFLARTKELTVGVIVSAAVGAAGFTWVYVNAIIHPQSGVANYMTWAAPISILIVLGGMVVFRRTRAGRKSSGSARRGAGFERAS
ncbi:putative amino acid transporter [Rhodococcus opacus B4]|uniref:Putative amino acid transporter n=2 Tax=Rhodococcus opacus TaxID=37919 RepID=C1B555_RHOOB|nr:putative amino acid transporter [Rhodococcus opacus B4]